MIRVIGVLSTRADRAFAAFTWALVLVLVMMLWPGLTRVVFWSTFLGPVWVAGYAVGLMSALWEHAFGLLACGLA